MERIFSVLFDLKIVLQYFLFFVEYLKGSDERTRLEEALHRLSNDCTDVPIVIGGKEYRTEEVKYQPMVGKW